MLGLLLISILAMLTGCQSDSGESEGLFWRSTVEPESAAVGDCLLLRVEGQWPDSLGPAHLSWQASPDTLLLIGCDSTALPASDGLERYCYDLSLLVPRAGVVLIPPVNLISARGETLAVTNPHEIRISGRLSHEAQPSLRPLAPMASLRNFPWWTVPLGVICLGALLCAWLLWRRRRGAEWGAPEIPLVPPAVEFRESLTELLARGLVREGRMRAFAQELSWILRRYLGRRWEQPALEATRPEILRWLPWTDLSVGNQQEVAAWLEATDGIKFAGRTPLLSEAESLVEKAEGFVQRSEETAACRENGPSDAMNTPTALGARDSEERAGQRAGGVTDSGVGG